MSAMQNILQAIYKATHTPQTGPAMLPPLALQDAAVLAKDTPGAAGVAPAPAVTAQMAPQQGVLGTIGSVLAPQAGSFWASALKHGLAGANQGMIDDPLEHASMVARLQSQQGSAAQEVQAGKLASAGLAVNPTGSITQMSGIGSPTGPTVREVYSPPDKTEKLITLWKGLNPEDRATLASALPGYRYSEEYTDRSLQDKKDLEAYRQSVKRFAPKGGGGRAASRGGVRISAPPPGFK